MAWWHCGPVFGDERASERELVFSVYLAKYRSSASRLLPLLPLLLRLLQLLKARHVSDSCRRSIDKHSGPCARSTFVAALRVSTQHNPLPLTHSLCCPCHSFPTHVNVQLSEPSRHDTNNSFEMRVICAFATSLTVGHPNAEIFNHLTFHVDISIFSFLVNSPEICRINATFWKASERNVSRTLLPVDVINAR